MRISDWSSDVCSSDLFPPRTPSVLSQGEATTCRAASALSDLQKCADWSGDDHMPFCPQPALFRAVKSTLRTEPTAVACGRLSPVGSEPHLFFVFNVGDERLVIRTFKHSTEEARVGQGG